jgi:Sulfite exporter TauE/SafE
VKWPCAIVFSAAGMLGALFGSALGKALDGTKLLALFGLVMIAVGIAMLRPPGQSALKDVRLTSKTAPQMLPRLLGAGSGVGLLSGFFGIGGGFLIVPGLVLATGMALQNAIASSLFAPTRLRPHHGRELCLFRFRGLAACRAGDGRRRHGQPCRHAGQRQASRAPAGSRRHLRRRGHLRRHLHHRPGISGPAGSRLASHAPVLVHFHSFDPIVLGVASAASRHVVRATKCRGASP